MSEQTDQILPVIGLEIHVELATQSKLFCRCRNRFGDPPNTNVCPVCLGMPGTLPVMNRLAVEWSMKVALALGCQVAEFTKWDRKGYYYPDLPKNYQISQYDLPVGSDGYLEVPLSTGATKRVRVLRAHLEEDAGKNTHDSPSHSGVDLNRASVPLLEIVSQPDMNTVEEAGAYARAMQRLVRWLGVSEANMQMGHMRFEPNINLHVTRGGRVYKTPITEVKNLNSFRALENTIAFEIDRHYNQWLSDPEWTLARYGKENRGYDDATGRTVFQREKEEAHDYRYFPDPDLVPVVIDAAWRTRVQEEIGELPLARRRRFMDQYALSFQEADALTQDAPTGDLLDATVAAGADARRVVNLLLGPGAKLANERGVTIAQVGLSAQPLAELVGMLQEGKINASSAQRIFEKLAISGGNPRQIAQDEGLLAVTDTNRIEQWVDEAIAANPQAVQDVRQGGKKQARAFGFLMGQVMQKSRGAATPQVVQEMLRAKIG